MSDKKANDMNAPKTPNDSADNKDKNKTGENQEQSKVENTPEVDKKEELVVDIIASNPNQQPEEAEEEVRAFKKKDVIEEIDFGWLYLNRYLNSKCQGIPVILRVLGECLIVSFLFLVFPITILYLKKGITLEFEFIKKIFSAKTESDPIDNFVQMYIFITCIYIVYVIVSCISENILYPVLSVLNLFHVSIDELTIQILQIIITTNFYWSNALVCFLIYSIHNYLFEDYKWFQKSLSSHHLFMTLLIGYGIWMFVLFIEKFFLNYCTSEIRRSNYRDRIWDINYKTFVFKKLVTLSKANPSSREDLAGSMVNDFDPGFYIRHNDIKLNSKNDAKDLVESIFAYFEIRQLQYKDIEKYFPENPEEVYEYLSGKKIADGKPGPIDFDKIQDEAVHLQQERVNMMRTLQDRESIFDKLDLILASAGSYGCILFLLALLGISYEVYLASIGPIIFTFSWIFSDTIKEIYNCFVFLLIKDPYDVGDRVIIDDKEYVVIKTDVLSSAFVDLNGKTVYIPTPVLFGKSIYNLRRSRRQSESLTLKIDKSTKFADAIKLRDKLKSAFLEDNKNFTGDVILRSFEISGDDVSLVLDIQHTSNFQQFNDKLKRRDLCTIIVQKTLEKCGITYQNSFAYTN
ncbi:mechanosensitive channel of small conductance (MscS1B) [Vairimorpha necatrix]|uniref:Mechanosensitive channel of small conductance (MscS1B) n=1 Tax=Vairimorpha necatrix TaxID=6039 RepID=A0AAX4JEB6_9MICR